MTRTVDFIFDFASPNAYLARKALVGVVERTGAKINYIPCLLGGIFKSTGNQPPMLAFGGVKGKLDYEMLETKRFIEKHACDKFVMNSHFPVNTLLLMRGAIAAERDGYLEKYIEAGLCSMWEGSKKMDDPEVYVTEMNNAGLDGAALLASTQDPDIKQGLIANTSGAVEQGCFGVPTFYVNGEMFFGKDRLGLVEEEICK